MFKCIIYFSNIFLDVTNECKKDSILIMLLFILYSYYLGSVYLSKLSTFALLISISDTVSEIQCFFSKKIFSSAL